MLNEGQREALANLARQFYLLAVGEINKDPEWKQSLIRQNLDASIGMYVRSSIAGSKTSLRESSAEVA